MARALCAGCAAGPRVDGARNSPSARPGRPTDDLIPQRNTAGTPQYLVEPSGRGRCSRGGRAGGFAQGNRAGHGGGGRRRAAAWPSSRPRSCAAAGPTLFFWRLRTTRCPMWRFTRSGGRTPPPPPCGFFWSIRICSNGRDGLGLSWGNGLSQPPLPDILPSPRPHRCVTSAFPGGFGRAPRRRRFSPVPSGDRVPARTQGRSGRRRAAPGPQAYTPSSFFPVLRKTASDRRPH